MHNWPIKFSESIPDFQHAIHMKKKINYLPPEGHSNRNTPQVGDLEAKRTACRDVRPR